MPGCHKVFLFFPFTICCITRNFSIDGEYDGNLYNIVSIFILPQCRVTDCDLGIKGLEEVLMFSIEISSPICSCFLFFLSFCAIVHAPASYFIP